MSQPPTGLAALDHHLDTTVLVLDLVRSGAASTRSELVRLTGLGRAVITQRVAELIESGLLGEGELAPSTGGRAARALKFRSESGSFLVAELGATSIGVGIADLAGNLLAQHEEPADIAAGPEVILGRVEQKFDEMLAAQPPGSPDIWGIGLGVPGPVEFSTGLPVAPPIMPGWDRYPVRERLSRRYGAPTWVDNDVNLMALGELRSGLASGERQVVYIKIGSGIGAGLISDGRLHRGAQGAAGDVGHVAVVDDDSVVCRCGNVGCLEAVAGGTAIGQKATVAARNGQSRFLAERLRGRAALEAKDVAEAAEHGDPFAVELLSGAGAVIGQTLATLVNFFNPSLVVIGGGVAGDLVLAGIRQAIYRRSLPLATRDLRITASALGDEAGLRGAAFVVADELFSRDRLALWIDRGSPRILEQRTTVAIAR
jgi:glucokinase-like ROK family protein